MITIIMGIFIAISMIIIHNRIIIDIGENATSQLPPSQNIDAFTIFCNKLEFYPGQHIFLKGLYLDYEIFIKKLNKEENLDLKTLDYLNFCKKIRKAFLNKVSKQLLGNQKFSCLLDYARKGCKLE